MDHINSYNIHTGKTVWRHLFDTLVIVCGAHPPMWDILLDTGHDLIHGQYHDEQRASL